MAVTNEFSATLNMPGAVTGSNVVKPSAAAAIGEGLTGLASIFDVGLKEYHKDRVEKAGLELENQLTPLAQAVGQGKMSSDEMLMRSSNIVSSAINKNPHISQELRSRAQTVLGVLPSAEMVKSAQHDEDVIKTAKTNLKMGFVADAAKSGVAVLKEDGSLDLDKSAEAGQVLSAADEKMKRLSADLENTYKAEAIKRLQQGTPGTLSQAEKRSITVGQVNKVITPTVNARLGSLFQNMGNWLDANKAIAEPQQEAAAKQEWARQKFAINQMVENYIAGSDHAFDSDETHDIRQNVNEMLEKYDSVFTGNFSNIKVNTEMVQQIKNGAELDFHRIAPIASNLIAVGGPQVAPQVLQNAWAANSAGNTALTDEGTKLVQHYLSVSQDPTKLGSTPREVEVVQTGVGAVENLGRDPTPQESKAWGNGKQSLLDTALSSTSAKDIRNAADLMTTPAALATLDEFKKDPAQAPQGQVIGRKMLQLTTQNILKTGLQTQQQTTQAPTIYGESGYVPAANEPVTYTPVYNPTTGQFEVQTTINGLPVSAPSKGALPNGMLPGRQGNLDRSQAGDNWSTFEISQNGIPAHVVLPTQPGDQPPNDETGSLGTAVDRYLKTGKSYGSFDTDEAGAAYMKGQSTQSAPPTPPDMQRNIRSMNNSMQALEHLQEYGNDADRELNIRQFKQRIVQGAGIPLKPGETPVDMPAEKQSSVQPKSTDRVQGTLGDLIDMISKETGVDPEVAHAFALEESGGRADAVSPDGEKSGFGLFQLSEGTAKDLGVDRKKPAQNVMGGIRYIKQLLDMPEIDGDIEKAAIGYIAGPQRIDAFLANPNKFPRTKKGVTTILKKLGLESSLKQSDGSLNVKVID